MKRSVFPLSQRIVPHHPGGAGETHILPTPCLSRSACEVPFLARREIVAGARGGDSTTMRAMASAASGRPRRRAFSPMAAMRAGSSSSRRSLWLRMVTSVHLTAAPASSNTSELRSSCPPIGSRITIGNPRARASAVVSPPGLLSKSVAAPSRSGISLVYPSTRKRSLCSAG